MNQILFKENHKRARENICSVNMMFSLTVFICLMFDDTDLIDLGFSPFVIGLAVTFFSMSLNFPSGPPYAEKRPAEMLAMSPNTPSLSVFSVSVCRVTESPSITNTVFISPVSTHEKH